MTHHTGFTLPLSSARHSVFQDCLNEGLTIAEHFPDFGHSRPVPLNLQKNDDNATFGQKLDENYKSHSLTS